MENNKTKIAIIGLWHLGCTVSASLAKVGYLVTGFDFEPSAVENLKKAKLPIAESGLNELTAAMLKSRTLDFSTDFSLLKNYQYIVIAYDTPVGDDDRPDLSVINKAVAQIGKYAAPESTLVIMSQVPAGTCRKIYLKLKKSVKGIEVVYNPENLRLSQAIDTYLNADRQIIGVSSEGAVPNMEKFYGFYKNPLLFMSLESAEMVKHGVNSFLAMSVSFINQLADLSEKFGADITEVVKGLKSDSRVGQKAFLSPGLGFAGGTLGRDLRVLESLSKTYKVSLPLIADVYKINQGRKDSLYKKINLLFPKLKGKKIALLGLVYKPGTDTLRRSLALEVAAWIKKQKAQVTGFDPALKDPRQVERYLELKADPYAAVKDADVVIIITEWPEFKNLDFKRIKSLMRGRTVFDTKNILNPADITKLNLNYYGTGIGKKI